MLKILNQGMKVRSVTDEMSYVNNYTTQREVKLKQIKMMVSRKLPAQILKEENKICKRDSYPVLQI